MISDVDVLSSHSDGTEALSLKKKKGILFKTDVFHWRFTALYDQLLLILSATYASPKIWFHLNVRNNCRSKPCWPLTDSFSYFPPVMVSKCSLALPQSHPSALLQTAEANTCSCSACMGHLGLSSPAGRSFRHSIEHELPKPLQPPAEVWQSWTDLGGVSQSEERAGNVCGRAGKQLRLTEHFQSSFLSEFCTDRFLNFHVFPCRLRHSPKQQFSSVTNDVEINSLYQHW